MPNKNNYWATTTSVVKSNLTGFSSSSTSFKKEVSQLNLLEVFSPKTSTTDQQALSLPEEYFWTYNKIMTLIESAKKNSFPLPSKEVIALSQKALTCIQDNHATLLFCNPTIDGGALIEFRKNGIFFILEIDGDTEIALLKKTAIPLVESIDKHYLVQSLQSSIANG